MKRLVVMVALLIFSTQAFSNDYEDEFDTLWESLWSQSGSPQEIVRWPLGVVKYRIFGVNLSVHRSYVLEALKAAALSSGQTFEDVSEQPNAAQLAQLHIEVSPNHGNVEPNMPCYVQTLAQQNWQLQRVALRMRDDTAYRCVFHEMMHAMGVRGHPTGKTVLGYFQGRRDIFFDLDQIILKAFYSPEMQPGMTPFEAIAVLTDVFARDGDRDTARKLDARKKYLEKTVAQMRDFAQGKGEPPNIVIRSGRLSLANVEWGRLQSMMFLGRAYQMGHSTAIDLPEAQIWYTMAANKGHLQSQILLARLLETQTNAESREQAYFWYGVAKLQNSTLGRIGQANLAPRLSDETKVKLDTQIAEFRKR